MAPSREVRDHVSPGASPPELPAQHFRAIFEDAGLPVVIADRQRRIIDCNDALVRWLGYARHELRGKAIAEISHPEDDERNVRILESAEANGGPQASFQMEKRYRRKDGETVWGLLTVSVGLAGDEGPGFLVGMIQDISGRKRAEEALRSGEEKLRSIFQAAPAGIGMVIDRVIQEANDRLCEMTGYGRDELVGRNSRFLYPTDQDYESVGTRKYAQISQRGIGTVETRWRRKDGAVIDVLLSSAPIAPADLSRGVTFTALDITDRKRAEQSLRESEERYRLLFELESDAIFVIENESGRILAANRAASELYGYGHEELLGLRNADLSAEPEQTERVTREASAVEQVVRVPLRFHCKKGGEVFPVEISGRFFRWGGRGVHIATIRDVSERWRAEQDRRRLEAQVRHVQKLESLGVMAGGIAHDFNNLLMAVLGNADLALLRLPTGHPARDNLCEVTAAAERAADLCRQMLAYAGKGPFLLAHVNLTEVVREMDDIFHLAASKKAVFRYDLDPGLPLVKADPSQVRQVVMNLILNASEALQENSGVVSVATGRTECAAEDFCSSYLGEELPPGSYVFFEVRDTGCGMDPETCQKIFDPFFSTKFTGRGLGLAAVLGIVRGHRGAISVQSEPGAGTVFRVLFPACDEEAVLAPRPGGVTPKPQPRGTVLLVDDEDSVRQVAGGMLEALGFRVLLAADGEEAVRRFREHAGEVGWVLLDLTMPRMGGEEAFRALRALRGDLPIVLSSGYDEQEVAGRFAGAEWTGFIQKPYTLARLRSVFGEGGG